MRLTAILIMLIFVQCDQIEQSRLSKEQLKIIAIYCMAMPECKKEMEK